jgi:uncharacterized protein YrrD
MLRTVDALKGMVIGAIDGEIGHLRDVYFDDHDWTLRYLVVDTGGWLSGRKVLITPRSVRGVRPDEKRIDVLLSRDQVRRSPDIDTAKPVSRQHEISLFDYYGYPYYWAGPFLWGPEPFAAGQVDAAEAVGREMRRREQYDPHLRSVNEVAGYHLEATDGQIGHIEDFLFDEQTWSIRYLTIDTRNWLPGKHVLVSSEWVERVSWDERKVYVNLTRDTVRAGPEYDREAILTASDEDRLYQHYGRSFDHRWSRGAH